MTEEFNSVGSRILGKCLGLRMADSVVAHHLMTLPTQKVTCYPNSLLQVFPSCALGEGTALTVEFSGGLSPQGRQRYFLHLKESLPHPHPRKWEIGGSLGKSPEKDILHRWLIILLSPERIRMEYKEGENTVLSMLFLGVMAPWGQRIKRLLNK